MKNLAVPPVDDDEILRELGRSSSRHAREMRPYTAELSTQYRQYEKVGGDPWALTNLPVVGTEESQNAMIELYKSKLASLAYIGEMRNEPIGACPMCGSEATGSLDHYLPKAKYPQFSIFSRNLVPCCHRCNNKRNDKVRGSIAAERPTHPYFDAFLSQRVVTVTFQAPWHAPKVALVPFNVQGDVRTSVQWHIENVVVPAGVVAELCRRWGQLCHNPASMLWDATDMVSARVMLARHLDLFDTYYGSKNSWPSAFCHGLGQCDEAVQFLLDKLP